MFKALEEFKIPIFNLPLGIKSFDFEINEDFFACFDYSIVKNGVFSVGVTLDKTESHINVSFKIKGQIQLTCDLSLEEYWTPVELDKSIIFKYADTYDASDDEIVYIEHSAHEIDLSSFIYEFINLEVPIRKVSPHLDEEDLDEGVMYSTEDVLEEEQETNSKEELDPRWEALKKLK